MTGAMTAPMTPGEVLGRVRLARTEGVGPITFRRLLRRFPNAAEAIDALPRLARAGGRKVGGAVPSLDAVEREMEDLARLGGRVIVLDGPDYPPLLALLDDAPVVLSVLGDVDALRGRAVALVGGRNSSANGRRLAEMLASDLALADLIVVSGMARGVDAAAHVGALRTGRTVAAVAGGVDGDDLLVLAPGVVRETEHDRARGAPIQVGEREPGRQRRQRRRLKPRAAPARRALR